MNRDSQRLFAIVGLVVVGAAFSAASLAQQTGMLEEIIVTAERRALSLQETPISIVAYSTETIELKGIETIEDIATFTPNLDIKGSRFRGNHNPVWQIRGLSGYGGTTSERTAPSGFSRRGPDPSRKATSGSVLVTSTGAI